MINLIGHVAGLLAVFVVSSGMQRVWAVELQMQGMQSTERRGPPPSMGGGDGRGFGSFGGGMQPGSSGRWWNDPRMATYLTLTVDQQKRMDTVFVQSRMKLIDLTAALQKEELVLEPLLAADRPETSRVLVQIDRVAQARAELEKANGRMLYGLRDVLTADQWRRLQQQATTPWGGRWH